MPAEIHICRQGFGGSACGKKVNNRMGCYSPLRSIWPRRPREARGTRRPGLKCWITSCPRQSHSDSRRASCGHLRNPLSHLGLVARHRFLRGLRRYRLNRCAVADLSSVSAHQLSSAFLIACHRLLNRGRDPRSQFVVLLANGRRGKEALIHERLGMKS